MATDARRTRGAGRKGLDEVIDEVNVDRHDAKGHDQLRVGESAHEGASVVTESRAVVLEQVVARLDGAATATVDVGSLLSTLGRTVLSELGTQISWDTKLLALPHCCVLDAPSEVLAVDLAELTPLGVGVRLDAIEAKLGPLVTQGRLVCHRLVIVDELRDEGEGSTLVHTLGQLRHRDGAVVVVRRAGLPLSRHAWK